MKTAIVFDMDGVLADTERLKFRAHRAAVEAVGGTLDADQYRREMGGAHDGVIRAFLSASNRETTDESVERYEARFRTAYRELLATDLRPMPGAPELLAACREQGRRLVLVTSSERWMADIVLGALTRGTQDLFEAVVTADDVRREKPDPEAYLRAREVLAGRGPKEDGPTPEEPRAGPDEARVGSDGARHGPAVAVEDTRAGIASASAAGLAVIAVRHDFNRDHAFDEAAAVIDSLAPAERFLALADEVARARSSA